MRLDPVPNQPPVGPIRETRVTILDNDQPAGALDRRWNSDNVASTTPRFNLTPGADSIVRGAAVQADQRTIIVGDFTSYNAEPSGYIARINTDGSYDTSFSPGSGADNFISSVGSIPPPVPRMTGRSSSAAASRPSMARGAMAWRGSTPMVPSIPRSTSAPA